ncbi:MAG: hypothetical protein MJ105_04905 [Lachnospiraceae bacterium]|nr:hypothetical protein [Lachnospiraceae bacterium]
MLYCNACGFGYEPGEKVHFCEKCGAKIEEESLTAVERKEAVLRAVFAETSQKESGESEPAGEPLFAQAEKSQSSARKKRRNRQNKGSGTNQGSHGAKTQSESRQNVVPESATQKDKESGKSLHAEHSKNISSRNSVEPKKDSSNRSNEVARKEYADKKSNPLVVTLCAILFAGIVAAAGILILCMTGVIRTDRVFGKATISLSSVSVNLPVDGSSRVVIENYEELSGGEYTVTVDPVRAVEVEEKGNILLLTGEKEGAATITISAKGFQDVEIAVEVTSKESAEEHHRGLFSPEGRAFETDLAKYYFLDGGLYFSLSEEKDDYICGSYSLERTDFMAIDEESRQSLDAVLGTDWSLYKVSIVPRTDVYCGYVMTGLEDMDVYVAYYGDHLAIVDYNWYSDGAREAKEIGLLSQGKLEDLVYAHMPGTASGGIALQSGVIPQEKLSVNQAPRGNWAFAYNEETNQIYQVRDKNLYSIAPGDLNTEIEPMLMEGIETDSMKQMVADFGKYLFYTKLPYEGGSVLLCFYAYETGMEYPVAQGFSVQDFVVTEEAVYATDYKEIRKICYDGSSETIYEGPVCSFLVDGPNLYVFDFYTWSVMDADTGENRRKLSLDTTGHSYEVDNIYAYDDGILVFAAYDRDDETVAVYYLDTVKEALYRVSDLYKGTASDVYHTAVDQKGGIGFSAEGGKKFVYLEMFTGAADSTSVEVMYMAGISEIAYVNGSILFEAYDMTGVNRHVYQYDIDSGVIEELENLAIIKEEIVED